MQSADMMTVVENAHDSAERRLQRRMRTLKTGKIVFNRGNSVFDCRVRNLSPTGALVEVQSMLGIPQQFEIVMDDGATRRACSVLWRNERMLGVRFNDAG